MPKAFNIPGEGFDYCPDPKTGPVDSGRAGVSAPKEEELGNHENSGPNPEQKYFDN